MVCTGIACVALLASAVPQVRAADFSIKPSITIGEEFTDNVFETNTNVKSDFITRTQPGFVLSYKAPVWDWDLNYTFDYRYYVNGSRKDDMTHDGNLKGLVRLIDEKVFLEVSDSYKRVSLDVNRDTTKESLFLNQSDQNIATISPYVMLRPLPQMTLKSGYRYANTWYKDPLGDNKQDHIGFVNISYELTPKLFLTGDYTYTWELPERNSSFKRHEAYVGPRYEYADKSFIYAQGGVISTSYDKGNNALDPVWNAGLTHTFDTAVATITAGMKYADDPLGRSILQTFYNGSLTKTFPRGSLTLKGSYIESSGTADSSKTYSGGFSGTYEVMQDLNGTLGFTYENYNVPSGTTDRYLVDCGLVYSFAKELTLGLSYKFIDFQSDTIATDNKQVNRVILEVKKIF